MSGIQGLNTELGKKKPNGAKKCARYLVDLFNEAIKPYNAPQNLIQVIDEPSVELTFAEAMEIAIANLEVEGKGHSISIHSDNKENIEYAANVAPVSRVLVNQICSTMNGGSFFNGFAPTTTLGCGSWGNNSISENLDYKHLINVTRIGYYLKDANVPSEEELWG